MASGDAKPFPLKNTAYRVTFPILDADGDLVTGAAGLDSEVSKDGGTFADCTNEATQIATSSGMYYLDLTATEMNADTVAIIVKTSTSGAKTTPIVIYPVENTDIPVNVMAISDDTTAPGNLELMYDGTGYAGGTTKLEVDIVKLLGTAWLTPGVAGTPDVNAKLLGGTAQTGNDVGADVNEILTDTGTTLDTLIKDIPTVSEFELRTILAADYVITSDTIAGVTAVTNDVGITQAGADKVWGTAARALTDKAGFALSAAGITSIWEKDISAFAGAGYAGTYLKVLYDDWLNGGRLDLIIDAILADTGEIGVAGAGLTDLGGMATGMKAEIESECNDALVALKLDHLIAVADADDAVNDSIIAKLASKAATADWSTFVNTSDSLEAIRDRGDTHWITGGAGSITDILNVQPLIPLSIDLANTVSARIGLGLTNMLDDLPSTAEITPGTITIDRKAYGGTSWTNIVNAAACSEVAGLVYYDEVFDSGTGYAAGDTIRVTFKSQKITVSANDYEITGTDGWIFYTYIREEMRGTDSAALASNYTAARAGYLENINNANLATIADISTLTATEIAYLNASISSRSSHAASAIWSVGTRALTDKAGFALSATGITAIWEKNISAYSGAGYAGTYLKNLYDNQGNWITATGFATSGALATAQSDLDIITGASGVVIQDGTIIAASLGADCITNAKIADNAIAVENIKDSAISAAKIATDAITATKIAANAIGSSEFAQAAADKVRASVCVTGDPANSIGKILYEIYTNRLTSARAGYLANINNANLATIADISTLTATEIAYLNASISSRSSHTAANVWAAANRALSTPANYKANVSALALEATLTAMKGASFLTGTDSLEALRNRGDSAWITGAGGDATAANQTAIINHLTDVKGTNFVKDTHSLKQILDLIQRTLGLTQENHYIDNTTFTSGKLTAARIRIYSVAGSVGTAADVISTYNIATTYDVDGNMDTYKVTKA